MQGTVPRSSDLGPGLAPLCPLPGTLHPVSPIRRGRRGDKLTRFSLISLDELFTLTPQATSGLGKVSDQPFCVQFRNMEPVGAKRPVGEPWGLKKDGRVSWVPLAMP